MESLKSVIAATADGSRIDDELANKIISSINEILRKTRYRTDAPDEKETVQILTLKALTNLMDTEERCKTLLSESKETVEFAFNVLMQCCQSSSTQTNLLKSLTEFLSNITRHMFCVDEVAAMTQEKFDLNVVLSGVSDHDFDLLLPLILNLTQSSHFRKVVCQEPHFWLSKVLNFLERHCEVDVRRLAAGIFKNTCFEDSCHSSIVGSPGVEALPAALCCLVSHADVESDAIDDEDLGDLPARVQAALREPRREREPDEEVRLRLVRAMLQLCATPVGREALVDANAYVVLRELFRWEGASGSRAVLLEAQHVIDVLITETEPDPRVVPDYDRAANFRHVSLSEDEMRRVERLDRDFLGEGDGEEGK